MKILYFAIFISFSITVFSQTIPIPEKLQRLPFGSIQPSGWIKKQMEQDMVGFVGHLDQLVPSLIYDPIYGAGRLQLHSAAKDLGNLKSGDAGGDDQYKWWNSETQSNWWDGYLRNALLLKDKAAMAKVKKHIDTILATQDADGYLGIYDKNLRYRFQSENGELWAKTTLYRGLLAYYEYSKDPIVWNAILKAVVNVMQQYPVNQSNPFFVDHGFSGGVAHGLTFTDVLDKMYQITGNTKYREYALFLYLNFSANTTSEKDVQLKSILDTTYRLQSHGVHTYEHLRPLTVAAYTSGDSILQKALGIYLSRIQRATTETGGAIGDEWIGGRKADATHIGYEYCSLQELMDSYTVLLQKSGNPAYGDAVENIFYNAAQGSRNPLHSGIAYLKTDNSFEMRGTKNGEVEQGRNQTRYKYSPAHQDVAVCCNPNAGKITPYFIQSAWMRAGNDTLVAALLAPTILNTTVNKVPVSIREITNYPYQQDFNFKIRATHDTHFVLKIRKPDWVNTIQTNEKYKLMDGYIIIDRDFKSTDNIRISFGTSVRPKNDSNKETYFTYGALVFANPIESTEQRGRVYISGFADWMYAPLNITTYTCKEDPHAHYQQGKIKVNLFNTTTGKKEWVNLVPIGKTILRQVSF